ncbi:MAG: hypothetical protein K2P09_07685 [Erysipelotrichales bacterium]|nr:hypothetical protein [Erysipelotrichales bacterium]
MNIFTKIKNIDSFTHAEQDLADFILDHPLDIIDCDISTCKDKLCVNVYNLSFY